MSKRVSDEVLTAIAEARSQGLDANWASRKYAPDMARELIERRAVELAYKDRNPMGGPARVFEAMAARIRAGEEYYSVLADYRFAVADQAGGQAE